MNSGGHFVSAREKDMALDGGKNALTLCPADSATEFMRILLDPETPVDTFKKLLMELVCPVLPRIDRYRNQSDV